MIFFKGAAGEVVEGNLYFLLLGRGVGLVGTWAWSLDVAAGGFESLLFLDDGVAVASFG